MTQEFLEQRGVPIAEIADARQMKIDAAAAWKRLEASEAIYLVGGSTVRKWQANPTNRAGIMAGAIGRSGNLRAPTLKIGTVFIIGFHEQTYRDFFG